MARISGVDLPRNKRVEIALTYIYGIGRTTANMILERTGIDINLKVEGLSDEQITRALFKPCRDVAATIAALLEQYGPNARVCAMPDGPMTIAYVKETQAAL